MPKLQTKPAILALACRLSMAARISKCSKVRLAALLECTPDHTPRTRLHSVTKVRIIHMNLNCKLRVWSFGVLTYRGIVFGLPICVLSFWVCFIFSWFRTCSANPTRLWKRRWLFGELLKLKFTLFCVKMHEIPNYWTNTIEPCILAFDLLRNII